MELSHYRRNLEVIAISAIISISVYFFVRILAFLYIPGVEPVLIIYGLFFLLAESFSIIHLMGFIIDIFHINKRKPKKFNFKNIPAGQWPSVAVLLPAKDEPKEVLEETISSLNLLDYENKNIYLLDGSDKEYFIETSKKLAEDFKINYFRSKNIKNGKAGVINDFLSQMKEEYLAIFDADQRPMPSFLKETVAIAEYDKKIAFVQTPQFYSNVKTSTIARGAAFQQAIFFESICEAKGTVGSMFCCGTNVLLKKKPLLEVGGFDERSVTEDFATSIKIHLKGYKSIYYNHVRAFGMAPQNLAAYFSQQARWSTGTAGILPKIFKYFLAGPDRMTINQWWEYFLSSSFYFIGWTFLILMIGPILFLILDLPVSFINPIYYIIAFVPYYIATSAVFYGTMKQRSYKIIDIYHGSILSSLIFPILITSTLKVFSNKKMNFKVTPKVGTDSMPFWQLWPWTGMIVLCFFAIIIGILKFPANPYAYGINIFWCVYHIFLLSHIYYFNYKPNKDIK